MSHDKSVGWQVAAAMRPIAATSRRDAEASGTPTASAGSRAQKPVTVQYRARRLKGARVMAPSRALHLSSSLMLALVISLCTSALAPRLHARTWSVRMSHPVLSEILGRGMQRSPTFRRIVSRLQASDVVVQVRLGAHLEPDAGVTEFVSTGTNVRLVRITVNVAEASDAAVALLAHELRHAVEIADAQTVSDAATYAGLYRAIGFASCDGPATCFDTAAAIEAGRRVMRELRS